MSAQMLLEPYSRSQATTTGATGRPLKPWPTMYDLPSEDPEEPGLPDIFHHRQPNLLEETFCPPGYQSDEFFVATDLNLYYDLQHKQWHKRPDWFAVLDVSKDYQGHDSRWSYVVFQKEIKMFSCHLCGSTEAKEEYVNEIFQIDGQPVLMEHIPAQACTRGGELTFNRETTELIRRMVHGEAQPVHSISMPVFDFARNNPFWQPTALPLPV